MVGYRGIEVNDEVVVGGWALSIGLQVEVAGNPNARFWLGAANRPPEGAPRPRVRVEWSELF